MNDDWERPGCRLSRSPRHGGHTRAAHCIRLITVLWPLVFPTRCLVCTLTSPPSSELVLSREQSRDLHDVIARSSLRPRSLIVGHEGRWGTIKGQLHWGRCRLTLSSCARVHARWLFPSGRGPADGKTLQIANILHRQLTGIQELHDIHCNLVVTQSVTQSVTGCSTEWNTGCNRFQTRKLKFTKQWKERKIKAV